MTITTIYLPSAEEALEGIGPWTVIEPETPNNVAAFEQDRIARLNAHYAHMLREHGQTPCALVNGSVGNTVIPCPQGSVNVSRGAW